MRLIKKKQIISEIPDKEMQSIFFPIILGSLKNL